MIARDLITNLIPPLKTSDSVDKAKRWMHEFNVSHLPIVNNEQFLGLLSEVDILDLNQPEEPIGNHELKLSQTKVLANVHLYDVIEISSELSVSLVPVVDEHNNYKGVITAQNLVKFLGKSFSVGEPGGIIELVISRSEYSLSEVSRLVETNDAHVISSFVSSSSNSNEMKVTLKVNTSELDAIIATFRRFEYNVNASYQETEHTDALKDRYDALMSYLKI